MGTTVEREPAQILMSMNMNQNNSNVPAAIRRTPIKRPLEEEEPAATTTAAEITMIQTPIMNTTAAVCSPAITTYRAEAKVSPRTLVAFRENNSNNNNNVKHKKYLESTWESDQPPVQEEVEITATTQTVAAEVPPNPAGHSARTKEQQALLPKQLKDSLRRLKNLLKLPNARRWVFCEYFFSDVDRELLFNENEFRECLRESLPNLKTRLLKRAEWRQIRRLIGRPRRCSQAFFDLERAVLASRRNRIRELYGNGSTSFATASNSNFDDVYIPLKIPKPLIVGAKVFARVRYPKDGVYGGTVDAVMDGRYRIIFDKDVVMPLIVPDFEVMSDGGKATEELVPVSFFVEKIKAAQHMAARNNNHAASIHQPKFEAGIGVGGARVIVPAATNDPLCQPGGAPSGNLVGNSVVAATSSAVIPASAAAAFHGTREDRCGNFPLRLIVMLVKLSKLMDIKKVLLSQVQDMNNEAERTHLYGDEYIKKFQDRYAKAIMDLEHVNRQLESYLRGTSEYASGLLPQLTEITVTSRPEALQKFCHTHAAQIVKNNRFNVNVQNGNSVELSTSLTALMLQIRALGQQRCNAFELYSLRQAVENIKDTLPTSSRNVFEDNVEVHVKQIEFTMQGGGDTTTTLSNVFQ